MKLNQVVALLSTVATMTIAQAAHAQSSGGCVVEQAAQAALDRQIRSIEAAQTDVSSFFQGENSCINGNLLNMIDFSPSISSLSGIGMNIGQQAINTMLEQAMQQACNVANDQIQDVTGNLNTSLASWDSGLSDEIRGIISNGQVRVQ